MIFKKISILLLFSVVLITHAGEQSIGQTSELPNILWIVSEDNSPIAGAYGDDFATTPHIDKLARQGFIYTHAYANVPVCSPARNTIITGMYSTSTGQQHMRSNYYNSDLVTHFPALLRDAGYYITNNAKEDYNIALEQTSDIWDDSSEQAHYKNRNPGQPFFAIFNSFLSHESSIHSLKPVDELRHDPRQVILPPYHPDTPEIRRDWAQYYDNIEDMDKWVGQLLLELEESGEAENTIIFYYGDHGGVLPRSKRFVYETGTHIPFIVHIPEKYKDLWPAEKSGSSIDRLTSFVDLAPTILSLAKIPVPDVMQGHAFLGEQKVSDPEYVFMFRGRIDERYDMSRAVRSTKYRYIRNYMPYRIYGQHLDYQWRAASIRSWENVCLNGGCDEVQNKFWNVKPAEELYDTENDPWEVNNLAADPAYRHVLDQMRSANQAWMSNIKDSGFIPEADLSERTDGVPIYDYMRSGNVPLERIIKSAERATMPIENDIPLLISYLQSNDNAISYWGATGLLMKGQQAKIAVSELKAALMNSSVNTVVVISEALYNLGERNAGRSGFIKALNSENSMARTHALNAIDSSGDDSRDVKDAVISMAQKAEILERPHYDHRMAKLLFDKWGINASEYGIEIEWSDQIPGL